MLTARRLQDKRNKKRARRLVLKKNAKRHGSRSTLRIFSRMQAEMKAQETNVEGNAVSS